MFCLVLDYFLSDNLGEKGFLRPNEFLTSHLTLETKQFARSYQTMLDAMLHLVPTFQED